ncbi:hypothetical protein J2X12_002316 [Pseudarthrobacter oxydans]|uniref:DUF5655 domain-containing protein n=2 Tax=Pseudarthrobacter oxydans TaxID=1671 RepID=A0AAW8N9G8_PSEOX|nr:MULTISPECIES: DUF5655 domain-containing protein [Pseudarthrobacter]MDR6793184.1 hypothetical protein [Pseudarthrobacter oxydans]MDR7164287.1 hypothetical protein [Pseudarthrobacter oxydans]GKV73473.1 hypothetical protein NCCP2145_28540 [Pseudarthrobacter sp. NCCP-2145]
MDGGEPWTVDRFFEGSGTARDIYEAAERMASAIGPMTVRVSRSQVSFRRRRGFAYLWRPGMYVRSVVPLVLSLALPYEIGSPRFKETAHPAPGIWMHHLELMDSSQLDGEVEQWLRQAYEAAG